MLCDDIVIPFHSLSHSTVTLLLVEAEEESAGEWKKVGAAFITMALQPCRYIVFRLQSGGGQLLG